MNPPEIKLYNSLSRTKERFEPQGANNVLMYVCGPTVYDLSHVGHARKEVVFDVMARYLRFRGFRLRYVRNVTDVDDKIIQRAQEEGRAWEEVARRYEACFREDMDAIGVDRPDHEPRATETIAEMQEIIGILMDKGFAYEAGGSVYFSVGRCPAYGKLSGRNPEELKAGARVEVDTAKRDPLDFALWKASKPGEPAWPSPWGQGRPGWHIECSAMSRKYLGETLDIHGGGMDLIFPHHENEVAQSEAATGRTFCRYWIHNGLLTVGKEKMSKSLGNYVTIQEALGRHHPETIRLFFLSHHYRSPVDYNEEALLAARKNLDYFYNTLLRIGEICGEPDAREAADDMQGGLVPAEDAGPELLAESRPRSEETDSPSLELLQEFAGEFTRHMDDDLNTAEALASLFRAATRVNRWIDSGDSRDDHKAIVLRAFRTQMSAVGRIFGIFGEEPLSWFRQQGREGQGGEGLAVASIEERVRQREAARQARDWSTADRIRQELAAAGVLLEDTPGGTRWKRQG